MSSTNSPPKLSTTERVNKSKSILFTIPDHFIQKRPFSPIFSLKMAEVVRSRFFCESSRASSSFEAVA